MARPDKLQGAVPTPQAIAEAPERAVLGVLEAVLQTVVYALYAEWPELAEAEPPPLVARHAAAGDPRPSDAPRRLAQRIIDQADRLGDTIRAYRAFLAAFFEENARAEASEDIPF